LVATRGSTWEGWRLVCVVPFVAAKRVAGFVGVAALMWVAFSSTAAAAVNERRGQMPAVAVSGLVSVVRAASVPADGVSCGAIHASSSQSVDTFAVRAVGVSCGLAKRTALVWVLNECGVPDAPAGNRVVRKAGNRCVIAVTFDPGSSKPLARQRTYVFDCRLSGAIASGTASAHCTYRAGAKQIPAFAVTLSQFGE
jgi:hypothetical protein